MADTTSDPVVVHLDGLFVGPDEWLVLSSRHLLTVQEVEHIKRAIPDGLRGRVLVVDSMDAHAVSSSPSDRQEADRG